MWPPNQAAFALLHVFPRAMDAVPDVNSARAVPKLLVDAKQILLEVSMQRTTQIAIGAALLALAVAAAAQKPITYPAKGQTSAQQHKDDGECYVWAKQTTGIDPAVVATAPPPQAAPSGGASAAKGLVAGAAGGAVIGQIAGGRSGEGAAIGALVGARRGAQAQKQQQAAAAQQAQSNQQQTMNTFHRAYGACMSGRGYTIM